MDVVGRQPAANQQHQQDAGPSQRLPVPGPLAGDRPSRRFHHAEGRARSQNQLDVPGHQVQVRLPAHLAPQLKHR